MASPSPGMQPVNTNAAPVPAAPSNLQCVQFTIGGLVIGLLIGGLLMLLTRRPEPPPLVVQAPPTPVPTATASPTATPSPIVVFVSGAVAAPGLYTLPSDARVAHAIAAAGGLQTEADGALLNQAQRLWDGAQIHVPVSGSPEVADGPAPGVSGLSSVATLQSTPAAGGRININTASLETLITLPAIGPARATAIIAGRPYSSVEDLERVSGIGARTIEQLHDLVTVD